LASGGGAATLDNSEYALRYILEVYDGDVKVGERQIEVAEDYTTEVNFAVSLPAKTYKFVFWADFTEISSPEADLTYKTDNADGLQDIEWKESTYKISDNLRDAYTAVEEIDLTTPAYRSITLQRPFGKLRILATDLQDAITNNGITAPDKAVLTYTHNADSPVFRKSFNALTGLPNVATIAASGGLECVPEFVDNVTVAGQAFSGAWLLAFDYFLVPSDLTAVSFDIELFNETNSLASKSVSNVPVGVNKLTTVIGGVFTLYTAELDVSIEDEFDDETTPCVGITLSDETISATTEGDDYILTITSTIAWTAEVNSSATWCTLDVASGDGNSNEVTVSVAENPALARSATITFKAGAVTKEVAVQQAAIPAPTNAASNNMWVFGTSELVWSDAIEILDCNNPDFTNSNTDPYCRSYTSDKLRYYYNWQYVNTNDATLCPFPWRVPSQSEFNTLVSNTNYSTLISAWGYGGVATGTAVYEPSAAAYYWSSTGHESKESDAYCLKYNSGLLVTDIGKDRGFQVRCVK
jgi:hypothetical protein